MPEESPFCRAAEKAFLVRISSFHRLSQKFNWRVGMAKKNSVLKITVGILLHFSILLFAQAQSLKTPAEESNFTRYSQNEDIARFLGAVDFRSEEMSVQVIGKTRETRGFPSKDIFLCIINGDGASSPATLNRKKPTFLLTASQHGNEQSAKEAALGLIRDLALGELKPLLQKMNFLIIPQSNPYGNWFDVRENEIELDMNRDHIKLEAEGVQAIHRVFRVWMPEVTMDVHEKGDDYYRVSIGCVSNINIQPKLEEFSRNVILAQVAKNLEKKRLTFFEYLVSQEMGIDSSAGVRYRPEDLAQRERMTRYSTADINDGRNSLGIYETLSFIQEGASRHDLATLKDRTNWQYFGIRFFAEAMAEHGEDVLKLVNEFRAALMEKTKLYSEDDLVYIKMDYARDEKNPTLILKSFENVQSPIRGILKVDKKAGETLQASDIAPNPYPSARQKVVTETIKNWFPHVAPKMSVTRPLGYIVPEKCQDVVETLLNHGVTVEIFSQDKAVDLEAYQVTDVAPAKYDYLVPEKLEVEKKILQTIVKKGDFYISCAQPAAHLIPLLLEPQSEFGLLRYWKYKLVPEKDNLFAFYRVVKSQGLPLIPYRNWPR